MAVLEHGSATVAFKEYKLLPKACWLLRHHMMLLADRGMPAHDLMSWLQLVVGITVCVYQVMCTCVRRYPTEVASVYPKKGEAAFYHHVGLWTDGVHRCNLVVASPQGVKEPWAVITNEPPTLQTLRYA